MSRLQAFRRRERADQARLVLGLAFLVLVGAFFKVQALESDRFRNRSEGNRLRAVPLAAPRGLILDRNGLIIAENVPGYAVRLLSDTEAGLRVALAAMGEFVPLDSAAVEGAVRRWASAPYEPVRVLGNATFETVALLEEHRYLLPGLVIQSEPRRHYPAGAAVGHVAGYLNEINREELAAGRFEGARLGSLVGRGGLEQQYDAILRGTEGVRYVEVNARGRLVREDPEVPAQSPLSGQVIRTRLDLRLQQFIDSMWTAEIPYRGSAVALDREGGILAFYSAPSYDPNLFTLGQDPAGLRELLNDPRNPQENRVLTGRYPPASPFKLATAAMALRRGLVRPDEYMREPCRGGMQFGNRFFRCWKPEGHGFQNLIGAMATSCDVYFYQLGRRLGINAILEEGAALGLTEATGVDLPGERSGFMPPNTAWYDRVYTPRGWGAYVELNLSIGQGENDQTLLNMVRFYHAVATNGILVPPYLVAPRPDAAPRSLNLTPEQLRILRTSMIEVIRSGTAARSRDREIEMAGKTGTAQNPHGDNHAWFIGYAPADDPEIVAGIFLEFGLSGSRSAPYVARIIRRYMESIRPELRGAAIQFQVVADTAPIPLLIPADSAAPMVPDTVRARQ